MKQIEPGQQEINIDVSRQGFSTSQPIYKLSSRQEDQDLKNNRSRKLSPMM